MKIAFIKLWAICMISIWMASCSPPPPPPIDPMLSKPEDIAKVSTLLPCACEEKGFVDLSENMPPAQQQGSFNDCVGWALAYACRSYYHKENAHVDYRKGDGLDSANLVSPYFIYNCLRTDPTKGINLLQAINFLKDSGSCTWDMADSLTLYTRPTEEQRKAALASALNIYSYYRIGYDYGVTMNEVKNALKCNNPVIVAVKDDLDYFAKANNDTLAYYWDTILNVSGSHAVVIVGYDDARGSFKFMNSYGQDWGHQGFGEMCYSIADSVILEAYVIKPNAPIYDLALTPIVLKGKSKDQGKLPQLPQTMLVPLDSLVTHEMRLQIDGQDSNRVILSIPVDSSVLDQVLKLSKNGPPLNVFISLFTLDSNGKTLPLMSKDTANKLGNGQTAFKIIRTKKGKLYTDIPYRKLNILKEQTNNSTDKCKPVLTKIRATPILYIGREPIASGKPIDFEVRY